MWVCIIKLARYINKWNLIDLPGHFIVYSVYQVMIIIYFFFSNDSIRQFQK